MKPALGSLKVLDFSTLLPGPYAGMFLADLGADVVRVEAHGRPDLLRLTPPFDGDVSVGHAVLNRSKRSLALDLKKPAAVKIVKRLVKTYDVLLEGFRPGVMDRLGIGYEALKSENPGLIYCAITGYGQTGPYKQRAGHDINYLALTGLAGHLGRRESGPPALSVQLADIGGGSYHALIGILTAVIYRQQTGDGQMVDVAMFDGALAWNGLAFGQYWATGEEPASESMLLNGGSFYDYYRTKDGRYLAVGSLEPKFWQGFCDAIGRPDLIPRGLQLDRGRQDDLKAEIRRTIAGRSLAEWRSVFAERDVCVEPVLSTSESLNHPQTAARQMVAKVPRHSGGTQKQIANPIKLSACEPVYRHTGSRVGEHSNEILREIGYHDEEIRAFCESGAVG